MEIIYYHNEYRKDVFKFIKDNHKKRKDQDFGAKVFSYFISVLNEFGESTERLENIKIDVVKVRYGVVIFTGKDDVVKLKRYTDKELKDSIQIMRRCLLSS